MGSGRRPGHLARDGARTAPGSRSPAARRLGGSAAPARSRRPPRARRGWRSTAAARPRPGAPPRWSAASRSGGAGRAGRRRGDRRRGRSFCRSGRPARSCGPRRRAARRGCAGCSSRRRPVSAAAGAAGAPGSSPGPWTRCARPRARPARARARTVCLVHRGNAASSPLLLLPSLLRAGAAKGAPRPKRRESATRALPRPFQLLRRLGSKREALRRNHSGIGNYERARTPGPGARIPLSRLGNLRPELARGADSH